MEIPRWYLEQTLNQEDLDELTDLYKERSELRRCCRDHTDEIAALISALKDMTTQKFRLEQEAAQRMEENATLKSELAAYEVALDGETAEVAKLREALEDARNYIATLKARLTE